eukprot:TRINITY_DN2464_c0_g4_i1.p1 TRINITY_DN2464_c0_g4~~TRINITY_DN2464_c0_g4_i1.p1  ORF type:complete len:271 (-),score=61.36 TRINITY_DN2464_c0_g4_i1:91-840(-)
MEQQQTQPVPTVVYVTNISPTASEKTLLDFFSFCGKINKLVLTNDGASQHAVIYFDTAEATSTALLLNKANVEQREIVVTTEAPSTIPGAANLSGAPLQQTGPLDNLVKQAKELDEKHNISGTIIDSTQKIIATAQDLDKTYKISETAMNITHMAIDKAKELDTKFGVSEKFKEKVKSVEENQTVKGTLDQIKTFGNSVASVISDVVGGVIPQAASHNPPEPLAQVVVQPEYQKPSEQYVVTDGQNARD